MKSKLKKRVRKQIHAVKNTTGIRISDDGKELNAIIVNPHAAGIDVGASSHFVCVGQDNVVEFGVYTDDLTAIVSHLQEYKVSTVAIESTGFYFQPLVAAIQGSGIEVYLINPRDVKNLKGRKTDVEDCILLQQMHSIGKLTNSYQPDVSTDELRTLTRHRKFLVEELARLSNKMNKALTRMNIHLSRVVRDITGSSGLKVIKAILDGERNPAKLESLMSLRCETNRQDIRDSLRGNWLEDHMYELRDCYELFETYREKCRSLDSKLDELMKQRVQKSRDEFNEGGNALGECPRHRKSGKNAPNIDIAQYAFELSRGVDLLEVPGIGENTAATLMAEVGFDLEKSFPSSKHFCSWLGFTPNHRISGGKVLSSKTSLKTNPLSKAFREAANAAGNTHSNLGSSFRSLAARSCRKVAIVATARKLATIVYNMLTKNERYQEPIAKVRAERSNKNKIKKAIKNLRDRGVSLEDLSAAWANN
jgi:transposase